MKPDAGAGIRDRVAPGFDIPLTHATVIHLRRDYLPRALMFAPLAPLRRLGFPRHSLRLVIPAGLALAVGLEGIQYLLPYRAWNVNDAIGNGVGVLLSPLLLAIQRPPRCVGRSTECIKQIVAWWLQFSGRLLR